MPRSLPLPTFLRSRRWLVASAWLLALVLTAWVASRLVLHFTSPTPPAVSPPPLPTAEEAVRQIAAATLFDGAAPKAAKTAAPAAQYRLIGVATGFGTWSGFALIQANGGATQAVPLGAELAPGVRLVRLEARAAEIERNGARETIPLAQDTAAVTSGVLTSPPRPPMPPPRQPRLGSLATSR